MKIRKAGLAFMAAATLAAPMAAAPAAIAGGNHYYDHGCSYNRCDRFDRHDRCDRFDRCDRCDRFGCDHRHFRFKHDRCDRFGCDHHRFGHHGGH